MVMKLPQNPLILASYINTMLRDHYKSLDELCAAMDIDRKKLEAKLRTVGMEYNELLNKFW